MNLLLPILTQCVVHQTDVSLETVLHDMKEDDTDDSATKDTPTNDDTVQEHLTSALVSCYYNNHSNHHMETEL